ncbi:MAG TPA: hypothetical protein VHU82_01685 [Vicinamibacterales bacterium]|jgi:hypothetical protein|nr:hypothetical protein [Vicinamibacterales bacterium]
MEPDRLLAAERCDLRERIDDAGAYRTARADDKEWNAAGRQVGVDRPPEGRAGTDASSPAS